VEDGSVGADLKIQELFVGNEEALEAENPEKPVSCVARCLDSSRFMAQSSGVSHANKGDGLWKATRRNFGEQKITRRWHSVQTDLARKSHEPKGLVRFSRYRAAQVAAPEEKLALLDLKQGVGLCPTFVRDGG